MRGKIVRMKNNARKYRLLAWKKMSTHVEEQALEKKIVNMDVHIYELKTDFQFMIDRVKMKVCQLNLQLAPSLPCVPVPIKKKSMGTQANSKSATRLLK